MAHKLTIEQLKDEYQKADREGREWLKKVQSEDEYTLNMIATVHMNAANLVKRTIMERIGKLVVEEEEA